MGQPDLDYTAPEVHATSSCSPQSDMFSLGLLITALFNQGHSLLESQLSISIYTQRIEEVGNNQICPRFYAYLACVKQEIQPQDHMLIYDVQKSNQ